MKVEIRTGPFNPWSEIENHQKRMHKDGQFGALACFIGSMRDFNEGEKVAEMQLEHYPGMTERHLQAICKEADNKWDLIEKESTTARIYEKKIKEHLRTFSYIPLVFTSALTKQRVSKILEAAYRVHEERAKEIKTGPLNSKLNRIIREHPPSSKSHREIKINYITQLKHSPPVICFFTNLPSEVQDNYRKFLESKVREFWGFEGVPLTLVFKRK